MSPWSSRSKSSRGAAREEAPPPVPGPVTAVREHRKHAGRYVVEIAGRAVGAYSAEAIAELGLRVGVDVDAALLPRVMAAGRFVACYDKATEALARRARSRADLERWLRAREFADTEIEPVMERLVSFGLLDDFAFARGFARSRATSRGHGRRRIAAELGRKGVPRAVVDAVLSELSEDLDATEPEAMEAAAAKRAKALGSLEPVVAQRRLFGWLVRRGYDGRAASEVARRLFPASRY
jgi:regulatory protein